MIDELNIIGYKIIPINEYFKVMDLSKTQIKEREEVAEGLNNALLFLFALISLNEEKQLVTREYITQEFSLQFRKVLSDRVEIDEYLERYITDITNNVVEVTYAHLQEEAETDELRQDNGTYWLSDGRAINIAENEANTALNYKDFKTAIEAGYTKKIWRTERDNRVRKTHKRLEGKTIPIRELFMVGDTFMRFPKDIELAGEESREIIGCRCSVKYIK